MNWNEVDLNGAVSIARVCGIYEIQDPHRLHGGKFKIKVLQRTKDFIALPNVCVKNADGMPEWACGLGQTEAEALQDALKWIMKDLEALDSWLPEQLESFYVAYVLETSFNEVSCFFNRLSGC